MICLLVLRELCALRFSNDNAMIFSAGINADNRFTTIDVWALARSTSSPSLHRFTASVVFALASPSLLSGILIAMIFVRLHVCLRACFVHACLHAILTTLSSPLSTLLSPCSSLNSPLPALFLSLVSCLSLALALTLTLFPHRLPLPGILLVFSVFPHLHHHVCVLVLTLTSFHRKLRGAPRFFPLDPSCKNRGFDDFFTDR